MPDIRNKIKRQREQLDASLQQEYSLDIADHLVTLPALKRARTIALYNAFRGEPDCAPLSNKPILRKKRIFLPIAEKNHLKFAPVKNGTEWTCNRYGILEPVYSNASLVNGMNLDVVIVPLVAFDEECNRIGMGAGFYDRTFAFRKHRGNWHKPLLIGIAYDFQRVDKINPEAWDVPLDCVVTEKECYGSY